MEDKKNDIDKLVEKLVGLGIILFIIYFLYEYIISHFKPKSKYFILCWFITIGIIFSYNQMMKEKNKDNHEFYMKYKEKGGGLSEDELNDLYDKMK